MKKATGSLPALFIQYLMLMIATLHRASRAGKWVASHDWSQLCIEGIEIILINIYFDHPAPNPKGPIPFILFFRSN